MKKKILSAVLACAATMSLTTCAFADTHASENPGATAPGATTPGASNGESGKPNGSDNKNTGIALAIAPAALAVAFVSVAAVVSKKKG